ncbi:MAG: replicative DNA helicase [Firmicutes bacterium]|nr:replicative DNA helicase [Bacillota bacterium]
MADEQITRVMPFDADAEMSVIGSMLMDEKAIGDAMEYVTADDFYMKQYGLMFQAIVELDQAGMAADPVTVQSKLREKNLPPETYSSEALAAIIAQVPTSVNVVSYAKTVADYSLRRRLIRMSEGLAADGYQHELATDALLEKAESEAFHLSQSRMSSDFVSIQQVVRNAMHKLEDAARTRGNVTGIASGFTDLDNMTTGFQNSDFVLIAARPSMGKTALTLNIAENVAVRQHKHVAIFSLEMSREQLINRVLSMNSHVDSQKMRTGQLEEADWSNLIESADVISRSGMILDETPAITVAEMRSKCRRFKKDFGLDLVMIDYLQLMSGSGSRNSDSRQQEVSEISRSLKALARELNVPVICLSQLSRAVESRTDKRPMLSDLRESGAIEQDADVVMFIYRDDYYHPESADKGISEIIIAKQRNGPVGTVKLKWIPELTKFANLAGAAPQERGIQD